MKTKTPITHLSALVLGLTGFTYAGEESDYLPTPPVTNEPDAFGNLVKFTLDARLRYEFRETLPFDPSHSGTLRLRPGILLGPEAPFSVFAEGEFTQAFIDDYRSSPPNGGPYTTDPFTADNSVIGDPNNGELNQLWASYSDYGFTAKIGRQRIIRNGAAFIGNVGWRQNEQTFDAAAIDYKGDNFSLSYAYSDRVQRIFGDDANDALPGPPLHDFEGDFHFIDATFQSPVGELGAYAYLIDVDNNASVGESNTFGLFGTFSGLYAELAFQTGDGLTSDGIDDYDSLYAHLKYSQKAFGSTFMAGVEYLGDGFKTPFATVHAFNGFADAFILNRIGLSNQGGEFDGVTDIYLGYVRPNLPGGITFKAFLHYFADSEFDDTYGWEADAILAKKLSDSVTLTAKAAYFAGDDTYDDIKQVTVQADFKF
ncbi:MAG: alginate export family protein [Verrucomicrobiota bacterium JB023]|nr:alginate export family protein [Verrucomicrobiota bacterium JB023]